MPHLLVAFTLLWILAALGHTLETPTAADGDSGSRITPVLQRAGIHPRAGSSSGGDSPRSSGLSLGLVGDIVPYHRFNAFMKPDKPMRAKRTYFFRATLPWTVMTYLEGVVDYYVEQKVREKKGGSHEYLIHVDVYKVGKKKRRNPRPLRAVAYYWDVYAVSRKRIHEVDDAGSMDEQAELMKGILFDWFIHGRDRLHSESNHAHYEYLGEMKTPVVDESVEKKDPTNVGLVEWLELQDRAYKEVLEEPQRLQRGVPESYVKFLLNSLAWYPKARKGNLPVGPWFDQHWKQMR